MQVTLRIAARDAAPVIERLTDCVLTMKEATTINYMIRGFWFHTNRTPMMILAALEEEGFHFADFDCIYFEN